MIYNLFTLYFQWSEWEKEKETVLFIISIRCIGIPYIIVGAYLPVLDLSISCGWHPYQPLSIHSHIILFSHKKTILSKQIHMYFHAHFTPHYQNCCWQIVRKHICKTRWKRVTLTDQSLRTNDYNPHLHGIGQIQISDSIHIIKSTYNTPLSRYR